MGSGAIPPAQRAALEALSGASGWRLVVLFGSLAEGGEARDVDLAVLPAAPVDLLTQGGWVARLESVFAPRPVDLLLLTDDTSPITRFEVFRHGVCLYETEEGLFDRELDRAFFLYADSAKLRQATREALRG